MSDNVIPFTKKPEEDVPCCESCELAQEYFYMLLDTLQDGSPEDVYGVIRDLVESAKELALVEHLQQEINSKAQLLDAIMYGVNDETEH